MKLQASVVDLDDTLFDTSGTLIPQALEDTFMALIESGLNAKKTDLKELLRSHPRLSADVFFDVVLSKFPLRRKAVSKSKTELQALAKDVYYNRPVPTTLKPFPKVKEWLSENKKQKRPVFLVSAGEKYTQEKKIDALGLTSSFKEIHIVAPGQKGAKKSVMAELAQKHQLVAAQILCLGNRLDDEIQIGHALGMTTCWIDRGEIGAPGSDKGLKSHYTVQSFEEFYAQWPNMLPRSS